jgi:hypothetical protein
MKAHGYSPNRRAGSPRFGTKSDNYDYSKVTEYTLSDEELNQYRKGGDDMSKFHKEEYLAFKDQGKTDAEIQKIWKIDYNKMQKLKKQWDIVTKPGRPAQKKEDTPSVSVTPATDVPEEPAILKLEPATDGSGHYKMVLQEVKDNREDVLRKLREKDLVNEELEKENLKLMKALSEQSKTLTEVEEERDKAFDEGNEWKNQAIYFESQLAEVMAALEDRDEKIEQLEKETNRLKSLVDQLKGQLKVMPHTADVGTLHIDTLVGEYETAVHERDAFLTTLKVLARL